MVNILAIIISAFVYFGIHMLWYFPFVFGNKWLELVGKESEPKEKIIRDTIIMIPTSFITVILLNLILYMANLTDIRGVFIISTILWCGFVATIGINQNNFNDRTKIALFFIEYAFYYVGFLVAGTILVLFNAI